MKKIEQFQGTQRRPRQFCHGEQDKTADSGKQGRLQETYRLGENFEYKEKNLQVFSRSDNRSWGNRLGS